MSGVKLSPKYGVNPTMSVCFWCGKEDGSIVLIGRMRRSMAEDLCGQGVGVYGDLNDVEAPRRMVMGKEPCENCKVNMAKGICLMEASKEPQHSGEEPEFTGRWWVVKEEFIKRVFEPEELVAQVLATRRALLTVETVQRLGLGDMKL